MKHTPGPWEWVDNKGWFGLIGLVGSDGTRVLGDDPELNHDTPDGCLIAAAPELLEALQKAVMWDGWDQEGVTAVWLEQAQTAIAKATGEG